ncbi:MAG: LptF/LptG family permease [Flavisolibacter sp.]|jgi:lipopolysaccharide export system permease protein|nr:LptF/LptG family permease [Flavisolibacter sp.]
MLKKIDWYIIRKLLLTFFSCMFIMTTLAVAIDISEKTDDFVKSGLNSKQIFQEYYIGFIPWIWGLLYPLFVFIAVIFFTSKMALRSEVIAILASGVSYNRWLRPYLMAGLFLAVLLFFAARYVLPKGNAIRSSFQSTFIDRSQGTGSYNHIYRRIDSITYIGMRNYDTASLAAGGFFMEKVRAHRMVYNLRAQRIEWDTSVNKWKLTGVLERHIDSLQESVTNRDVMHLNLNIHPRELKKDEYLKDNLTTPELSRYIINEEERAAEGLNPLKVEMYRRVATPFTVLLLTLIGAVIAGRRSRGGSGLHLAIGIIIAAIFIVSDKFSTTFSVKGDLPPLIAAWIPNIFFSFVALYLYKKAPK